MKDLLVGIDLGTTNSVLAVVQDGNVRVIDIHGQPTMPSCVGINPMGTLVVGQTARNQLVASPESTVMSIKRRMGEDVRIPLGDHQYSPEEISSFILRELKLEGERQLGVPIRKAVITVPAFFNERQRKSTQIAGELAGLEVVRIINEPTAAALAYGAGSTADETMLVYDLGGGTFDVSVVVVEQGVVEVKASHGDTHLGGDDFDDLLIQHAMSKFKDLHGVDLHSIPQAQRRLKLALERAKCRLSDEPFVHVREEFLDGKHHLELEIQRSDYEAMIQGMLEKTLGCLHKSLEDAGLLADDIDKVMLVGGSTRTPLVHEIIEQRIDIEPKWEINPDLIVAMGAAIQGAVIAGEKHHSILVDITPHTFSTTTVTGTGMFDELMASPIIRRNTPLPASKSEIFSTNFDNQDSIMVDVLQGESDIPSENLRIGQFEVTGLRKVPAGNPIVIHFSLDLNGMITVTATEKETGLAKTVTMDTKGQNRLSIEEARQNIAGLIGESPSPSPSTETGSPSDSTGEIPIELLTSAKDLRKRAEALLERGISEDDAKEIRQGLHDIAEAIRHRDAAALSSKNDALSDLVFYLED